MIDQIVELKGRGLTWAEIGGQLGISGQRARGLYRRHAHKPSLEALKAPPGAGYAPAPSQPLLKHPSGWEPGVDTAKGVITTRPSTERDVRWDEQLKHFGFDPELYEIIEPYHVRTWDALRKNDKGQTVVQQMWYHRANIRRRVAPEDRLDVEALISLAANAPRTPDPVAGDCGLVFVWADAQIGKSDGDGTKGIVERMGGSVAAAVDRITELRYLGRAVDELVFVIAGDLIESTSGHYAMQEFEVELNLRDQKKVARRLIKMAIDTFAQLGLKVVVVPVPGNHPENRKDGKLYTTFGDNGDLEIVEQVAEICEANPAAYGDVHFVIPRDEMELTLNVHGTILGLAHGQQVKGRDIPSWWEDQMAGRQPVGEADILLTAHRHHLVVQEFRGRWWFQAPALESTSNWFKHTHGSPGLPGVLTFVTGDHRWSDLEVL